MSSPAALGLPEALERAAEALPEAADAIRPANGDPIQLFESLSGAGAVEVLEWLLVNEPAAGEELALCWADDPDRSAGPLLQISTDGLPKAARKLLRRVHHRLRSAGVELPAATAEPVVSRLPAVESELDEALVSAIDPMGTRMVFIVEGNPAGGARLFEVMCDEVRGIAQFEIYTAARGQMRRFLRDFSNRDRFPGVAVPSGSARALVARIAELHPSDRPLPRAFVESRTRFTSAADGADLPGDLARAALGDAVTDDDLERAVALATDREVGPWPPPTDRLRGLADKLDEVRTSKLIASGAARREQAEQMVRDAVPEIYADEFAELTAGRWEETAYLFWKSDREDDARACLAAATALRDGSDTRVAAAMLDGVVSGALEKLAETDTPPESDADPEPEAEEPSLIVSP